MKNFHSDFDPDDYVVITRQQYEDLVNIAILHALRNGKQEVKPIDYGMPGDCCSCKPQEYPTGQATTIQHPRTSTAIIGQAIGNRKSWGT